MPALRRPRRLWDAYRFPGFQPSPTVTGIFGEPHARILTLTRRSKNGLRDLWPGATRMVRSQTAPGARSRLRRPAHLPGRRGAARGLSALWHGEAGTARVSRRQSLLHEALRVLRGLALSGVPHPGCGQGAAARLAHREGARAAVHARAVAAGGDARTAGARARRGLDQEGPH